MTGATGIENAAKRRMMAGEVALGMIVRVARTVEIARVAKAAGHDFLFLDAQHAPFNIETIAAISQLAAACGVAPLVRVRGFNDPNISIVLDAGAMGVIVPDVNTSAEAAQVVSVAKFAPTGRRSIPGPASIYNYQPMPPADTLRLLNEGTLVVCMVETKEGIANAAEIAAVPGVDVVHVGCNDLLVDMGKPGAFGGTEIRDAVHHVIECCRKAGKFTGLGGDKNLERQKAYIRSGVRFVSLDTDLTTLLTAATGQAAALRAG